MKYIFVIVGSAILGTILSLLEFDTIGNIQNFIATLLIFILWVAVCGKLFDKDKDKED